MLRERKALATVFQPRASLALQGLAYFHGYALWLFVLWEGCFWLWIAGDQPNRQVAWSYYVFVAFLVLTQFWTLWLGGRGNVNERRSFVVHFLVLCCFLLWGYGSFCFWQYRNYVQNQNEGRFFGLANLTKAAILAAFAAVEFLLGILTLRRLGQAV